MKFKIKNLRKGFTHQNFPKENLGGFTLIEVLVAMTLFVATLVLLSQIYVSAMRSERVAYALLQNEESVRYALDTMSKTIRMGKGTSFNISDDKKSLDFDYYYVDPTGNNTGWQHITYTFENNTITRDFLGAANLSLLPESVKITSGTFGLTPLKSDQQAEVTISFTAISKVGDREYPFQIRTAVTPRLLFDVGNPTP